MTTDQQQRDADREAMHSAWKANRKVYSAAFIAIFVVGTFGSLRIFPPFHAINAMILIGLLAVVGKLAVESYYDE